MSIVAAFMVPHPPMIVPFVQIQRYVSLKLHPESS